MKKLALVLGAASLVVSVSAMAAGPQSIGLQVTNNIEGGLQGSTLTVDYTNGASTVAKYGDSLSNGQAYVVGGDIKVTFTSSSGSSVVKTLSGSDMQTLFNQYDVNGKYGHLGKMYVEVFGPNGKMTCSSNPAFNDAGAECLTLDSANNVVLGVGFSGGY